VITSARFSPRDCHTLIYSSSKGAIKIGDMRAAALCDRHAKLLEEAQNPATKSFFSEIVSSISDVQFTADGRYIVSRDYLTVKIWDVNMESRPVESIAIHDHLRPSLCDLYEVHLCAVKSFDDPSVDSPPSHRLSKRESRPFVSTRVATNHTAMAQTEECLFVTAMRNTPPYPSSKLRCDALTAPTVRAPRPRRRDPRSTRTTRSSTSSSAP